MNPIMNFNLGGPARVPTNAPAAPAAASAGKMIKIQITVPARAGADPSTAKSIAVLVPANALQGIYPNSLVTVRTLSSQHFILV